MSWYKSTIAKFFSFLSSRDGTDLLRPSNTPSVLYQIKNAPSLSILSAVQLQNVEAICPDNIAIAHLRIQASKFLIAQIVPVLHRLESYLSTYRAQSQALRERRVVLRISSLVEAERLDALADVAQDLRDNLYRFVGLHVQTTNAIRLSLQSNRSDDLARAIVDACRQTDAIIHAVQSAANVSGLRHSLVELLHKFFALRDVSYPEHVADQLDQFWEQCDAVYRYALHDSRIAYWSIQRELVNVKELKSDFEEVIGRELSPPWSFMRHPVRYVGLTCIAACASYMVVSHLRFLGGTGKLEDAVSDKMKAFKLFANMNIIEPTRQLYEQVFVASPVTANEESVAASKSAVRDLLIDFTRKHLPDVPGALELAETGSMKAMFDLIRNQAGTPVRSLLQGSLAQAMLIQIQKLKCDVEELMVKTKQTLRAQELNLALLALVPSLLSGAAVVYLFSTISFHWRNRGRDMIVSSGQTVKFLLTDIQCSLLLLDAETKKDPKSDNSKSLIRNAQHVGFIYVKIMELDHLVRSGAIAAPPKVLLRFQKDLAILQEAESTIMTMRGHVERILSSYTFLIDR